MKRERTLPIHNQGKKKGGVFERGDAHWKKEGKTNQRLFKRLNSFSIPTKGERTENLAWEGG